jgi:hypothetical protein
MALLSSAPLRGFPGSGAAFKSSRNFDESLIKK